MEEVVGSIPTGSTNPPSRNVSGNPEARISTGGRRVIRASNSPDRSGRLSPRSVRTERVMFPRPSCSHACDVPKRAGALDTAHGALQARGQIFRYAVATGLEDRDPAAARRRALPPPVGGHFASISEPTKIGALLRSIEGCEGTHVARCALRLAPLVFARPGELRKAEWSCRNSRTNIGSPRLPLISAQREAKASS